MENKYKLLLENNKNRYSHHFLMERYMAGTVSSTLETFGH